MQITLIGFIILFHLFSTFITYFLTQFLNILSRVIFLIIFVDVLVHLPFINFTVNLSCFLFITLVIEAHSRPIHTFHARFIKAITLYFSDLFHASTLMLIFY